jgi:hypothetical protein
MYKSIIHAQLNATAPDIQSQTIQRLNPRAAVFRPVESDAKQCASLISLDDVYVASDEIEIVSERPDGEDVRERNGNRMVIGVETGAFGQAGETGNGYGDGGQLMDSEYGELSEAVDGEQEKSWRQAEAAGREDERHARMRTNQ